MRKVAGEHPFCVLIYMNSYMFHICFILFILLSYLIFDFACLTLSLGDTHGIAKYARTYIRDTHTRTQKKFRKNPKKKEGKSGKKESRKRQRTKRKGGKRRRKMRGKGGEEGGKKGKRERDGFRG